MVPADFDTAWGDVPSITEYSVEQLDAMATFLAPYRPILPAQRLQFEELLQQLQDAQLTAEQAKEIKQIALRFDPITVPDIVRWIGSQHDLFTVGRLMATVFKWRTR